MKKLLILLLVLFSLEGFSANYKVVKDPSVKISKQDIQKNNKSIEENALEKNDYDVYLLEWKWLDGANDVKAGFNQSNYKLNIEIKAKS